MDFKKNLNKNFKNIMDEGPMIPECFDCHKQITEKPWMTLDCDDNIKVYCCSYICSKHLKKFMGGSYWDRIVNKEDFTKHPIPIQYKPKKEEICFNDAEIEMIQQEIDEEEERMNYIEYSYSDSSESISDEEYYFK